MNTDEIIEVIGFANGNDRAVRLTMQDATVVTGFPVNVDLHPTAYEVFLRIFGDENDTETTVSLAQVTAAELV